MLLEDFRGNLGKKGEGPLFIWVYFAIKNVEICGDYCPTLLCLLVKKKIRLGSCANGIFILFGNGLHEGKHLFNGVENVLQEGK
jgi:hypothetical protein